MKENLRSELQSLFKGVLRDYQIETLYAIILYYLEGNDGNVAAALPTGSGKTPVLSALICYMLYRWPNLKFMLLSHVKNILDQNHKTLLRMWPTAPVGVFSAGLNQRETNLPIIIGGIASVINSIDLFGHRDVLLVDEVHLISSDENTMYRTAITELRNRNPNLIVIGVSATLYRVGMGLITEGGVIDDIVIDLTTMSCFNRFFDEGYLARLIPKRTNIEIDTTEVKMLKGDFASKQLDTATEKVIYEALKESMGYIQDRNCGLVFCSGIKSSEHAAEILQSFGVPAAAIHSKLTDAQCDERFEAFKRGELKAICGNNKFTIGFDFPPIDFCIMLRPTMSPGLWIQMLGRCTRPYDFTNPLHYVQGFKYVKQNCVVLDFAGNCRRLGPINDVVLPRKKGDKSGDAPIKICEAVIDGQVCGVYNHASARVCCECGTEFPVQTKLLRTAGTEELIRSFSDEPVIETFDVTRVIYHKHNSKKNAIGVPCLKVSYYCGLQRHSEYVPFEAKGMIKNKATAWWQQRSSLPVPVTVDDALIYVSQLRCPKRITVVTSGKFPEITSTEW